MKATSRKTESASVTRQIALSLQPHLEAELLEEPLVLSSLVLFFQNLLDFLLHFLLGSSVLQDGGVDGGEFGVEGVTGGHDVGVVDDLDEGLDAGTTSDALGTHGLGDLEGSGFDTDDQGATESLVQ